MRHDILETDGLLFLGDRLIVPAALRKKILKTIHECHLGIGKTNARANQILYWPGVARDIEEEISQCEICQRHRKSSKKSL